MTEAHCADDLATADDDLLFDVLAQELLLQALAGEVPAEVTQAAKDVYAGRHQHR